MEQDYECTFFSFMNVIHFSYINKTNNKKEEYFENIMKRCENSQVSKAEQQQIPRDMSYILEKIIDMMNEKCI